jgi:hypothetical protein
MFEIYTYVHARFRDMRARYKKELGCGRFVEEQDLISFSMQLPGRGSRNLVDLKTKYNYVMFNADNGRQLGEKRFLENIRKIIYCVMKIPRLNEYIL